MIDHSAHLLDYSCQAVIVYEHMEPSIKASALDPTKLGSPSVSTIRAETTSTS